MVKGILGFGDEIKGKKLRFGDQHSKGGEYSKLTRLKGFSKLASRVLETRVLYKTRGLKSCFVLDELDTIMPHGS